MMVVIDVFFISSEEAMRKAGTVNTTHKSGNDMENHVYVKAKTRVSTAARKM